MPDDVELAMTEAEWERWQALQPPLRPDPEHEPDEPWARPDDDDIERERRWL